MMQDPIGDMIVRIKNASAIGTQKVTMPYSRLKENIANILVTEGYIESIQTTGENIQKELIVKLKYNKKLPAIIEIKRLSKPGLRLYVRAKDLPKVQAGRGMLILSTPGGVLSGREAYKQHVGGELICKVW